MNTTTPRVFIAATRQNDGKTTASLGLIAALQQHYPRVGYIKPVGQRFVEIAEQKIDEDTVLMDSVYQLNCPLVDMSPIAVEPDFTRKYLQSSNNEVLITSGRMNNLVEDVVVGAMGAQNAMNYFKRGVLLITPGDREDIILAACTGLDADSPDKMAGIVLTGNLRPNPSVLKVIRAM